MVKKIISVATAFLMLCCMVPFYAFAESATCPKCGKDTLITNQDISVEIGEEVGLPLSLKRAYCSTCHYAKYEYNVLGVTGEQAYDDGDESHIINFLKSLKEQLLGKNSTATKFQSGGGSTSGGGVGRPKGYDDNGSALVSNDGMQRVRATFKFFRTYDSDKQPIESFTTGDSSFYAVGTPGRVVLTSENISNSIDFSGGYFPVQQLPGYYTLPAGTEVYNFNFYQGSTNYPSSPSVNTELLGYGLSRNYKTFYVSSTDSKVNFFYVSDYSNKSDFYVSSSYVGNSRHTYTFKGYGTRKVLVAPHDIYLDYTPDKSSTNLRTYTQYNIKNNNINNTWNGNIYTDNSTNLTYIYPQYTTINEKNETITNISNTPIIYNNETKQYYTYDQTTKNYYYITYNAPSPSPTPAPTEKPGGSISTPETGKPGGDTGDTTGILAVLVEIRDNMIQGFLDIKAAFVAGFAELSANFALAIENLNVNIQNTFNKKFPDLPEPTPEPALPAPVEPSTGDKWSDDIVSGTSISGTVNAKAGDYVLATVSARSALTIPDSMTYLYKGNVFASNTANQSMSFAYQKIAEDGTYTYTFKQATADRMYLSLIVLSDIDGLSYSGKYHIEVQSKTPVSVPEKSNGDMLVWGCSSSLWLNSDTSNSKSWITNPDDLTYIGGASNSGQSRQANFIDLGTGAVSRTFLPYEDSGGDSVFVVDAVEIIPKTITPSPSPSPSPSPAPDPGKPDSGDKTNNFWTIIFPNGGGSEDGKKGIFWALVSLILALIAFFANLAVGVGYLFPFLPDGVVMTINTCLIVIFLFTIIKFIMRSK